MKPMHSIYYDALPDWFIAYDVWSLKQKRFLDEEQQAKILDPIGIKRVPVLYVDKLTKEDIPKLVDNTKSAFSTTQNMEGCVVKDYQNQQMLKYVSREFLEEVFDDSGHWTSRREVKYNRLKE
jgi:ATP-dependent RNA circularization protein (DNA/RNA ligase family)